MYASVVVQSQDDFEGWLADNIDDASLTPAQRGERVYNDQGCISCHSLDGSITFGPSFLGLAGSTRSFTDGTSAVADDNYLRMSIVNPTQEIVEGFLPTMPPQYATILSTEQIDALVEFIKEQQ